jgi:hypothetical protein
VPVVVARGVGDRVDLQPRDVDVENLDDGGGVTRCRAG